MIIKKPFNANYQWVVLVITVVAQTATAIVVMGMSALAPFFQQDFGLTRSLVGTLVVSLNVGSFISLPAAGKAVDRFGERMMILVGGALLGLTSMAIILVHTYYTAFLIFVLAGFWMSLSTPAGSKAVMSWFAERQRGMAMGIRQTGFPIGGMIGALILPILATSYNWRFALFFAGACVILGSGICYLFYKDPPEQPAAEGRQVSIARISSTNLLKNPSFLSLCALAFCLATVQSAFLTYLILYSMEGLATSLTRGSYLLAITQLAGIFGRVLWGMASDRLFDGRRLIVLALVTVFGAVMLLILAFLNAGSQQWSIVILIVLLGFSIVGWSGLFTTFASELGGRDNAGMAVGLAMTINQLGIIFGPPLFGLVVDVSHSYRPAWLMLSGLLWVGLISYKLIRKLAPVDAEHRTDVKAHLSIGTAKELSDDVHLSKVFAVRDVP